MDTDRKNINYNVFEHLFQSIRMYRAGKVVGFDQALSQIDIPAYDLLSV